MTPVALITGAGSGIGRALVRLLAPLGYQCALVGRRERALHESLNLAGVAGLVISADLAAPGEPGRVVDVALARFGRLDAIVNNAGWSPPATIAQTTPELARRVYDLNALAPTLIIARAWPALLAQARRDRRGARIVNVSSMATLDPFPMLYAYAAAKSAAESIVRSIANEGGPHGIRAFAVAPGAVETDLLRSIVPASALPTSRTLSPEAVAQVIASCLRGERDGETGQVIRMPSP